MSDALLARLADAVGIVPSYFDLSGNDQVTTPEITRALLKAMGYGAETSGNIRDSLHMIERFTCQRMLPEASVVRAGGIFVTVPAALTERLARWTIICEDGTAREGAVDLSTTAPTTVQAVDGSAFARYELPLPADLARGYHQIVVEIGPQRAEGTVIAVPDASYSPEWLVRGERLWGTSCHLYSLRSRNDWGIGDFGDLAALAEITRAAGGAVVAINPLHALFPHQPALCSPYWPSSRLFLNPLYLDLAALPELRDCAEAKDLLCDPRTPERIAALKAATTVNYADVIRLKHELLDPLVRQLDAQRPMGLDGFISAGGAPLQQFAVFCALSDHFGGRPWDAWPHAFQDPASPNVARWADAHRRDVRFHLLQQWLVERQFAATAKAATGLAIGFMRDLAVGVSPGGADAWRDQVLYPRRTRFGAPPDMFSTSGQDWGLPPPNPRALTETGYKPFIAAIRSNMAHAGALRIDHVMSLDRLFWIPEGVQARDGAYVRYPFEDLVGIVALESARARCVVVGEDLGVVPSDFRGRMERENILSTRIFLFERHDNLLFKRPAMYPGRSVAQATTHDTSTIAGYWRGRDLAVRAEIEPDYALGEAKNEREIDRRRILAALVDQELLAPDEVPDEATLILAVHRFLGRTPSQLFIINVADVMAAVDQLNLPGTVDEHPNWRTKLPMTLEELAEGAAWRETVRAVGEARATGR